MAGAVAQGETATLLALSEGLRLHPADACELGELAGWPAAVEGRDLDEELTARECYSPEYVAAVALAMAQGDQP
jgi:hypothetical protein